MTLAGGVLLVGGALAWRGRASETRSERAPAAPEALCEVTQSQARIAIGSGALEPLCDLAYAEPGLTEDERRELRRALAAAERELTLALGPPQGPAPLTIFCRSAPCKEALGAAPAAAAASDLGFARDGVQTDEGFVVRPVVVVTGPVERTAHILVHERVHAEMKAHVPYDGMPTWFNEGVASFVAGEPRCGGVAPAAVDVATLATKSSWQRAIQGPGATLPVYCRSRLEVERWVDSIGGRERLGERLRAVMGHAARTGQLDLAAR